MTQTLVIPQIVGCHAGEASSLWELRGRTLRADAPTMEYRAALDSRLEAHLDGLRVAGPDAWPIVREALPLEEPGEVFAAAALAFDTRHTPHLDEVLAAVAASPGLVRGLVSALGWLPFDRARPHLEALLASEHAPLRAASIGGWAAHRRSPGVPVLHRFVTDADARVRARSLRAIGELRARELAPEIERALADADEPCRFWSAWSGAVLGIAGAVPVLRAFAEGGGPFAERAADLAARRLPLAEANAWRTSLATRPERRRLAMRVAGTIGDPVCIPWLLGLMADPALARPAAAAFSAITGVDFSDGDLRGTPPAGFHAGPSEDPDDDVVAMDPDENLPWPASVQARQWWKVSVSRFPEGTRFQLGLPRTAETLRRAIDSGPLGVREGAAIELAWLHPEGPIINVHARCDRVGRPEST